MGPFLKVRSRIHYIALGPNGSGVYQVNTLALLIDVAGDQQLATGHPILLLRQLLISRHQYASLLSQV
jgi:hypothetical protein